MSRPRRHDAFDHCRDLVRKADPDRLLLAELAPPSRRPSLWALAAFHCEVARIPERVSEPMLGSIRRQWWRDAWTEIADGKPRRHPVVEALAATHADTPFDPTLAETMLEAWETEHEGPPDNLAALQRFAEATGGSLARLEAQALGLDGGSDAAAAAEIGTAWALIGTLRSLPAQLRHGRHTLPLDRLSEHEIDFDRLDPTAPPAGLAAIVEAVAKAAAERLSAAPRPPAPLFRGYRRLALLYRDRLRQAGWNPFYARINAPTVGRAWQVARVRIGL